jgi:hypothetical protein
VAQNRSDNFNVTAPKPIDNRYLKNGSIPYSSVIEAHSLLTYRYIGLTVLIFKEGVPTEYWYQDDTASSANLVEKSNVGQEGLALKQDKEVGKGLSTNDFSNTYKSKLDGIQSGATVNATNAQLRDRSSHTGTQAVSTITGLAAVATTGSYSSLTGQPNIPSTLDQIADSSTRSALTSTDRGKLSNLAGVNTGDETATSIKSKLGIVSISGINTGDQDISGIAANTTAIGTLNALSTSVKNNLVSAINEVKAIADTAAGGGTIPGDNTITNAKLGSDVKIGSLTLLTTVAKGDLVTALNELNSNKVDKVSGKVLSSNDYTTVDKNKLAGIATGATANSTDSFLLNRTNHTGTDSADNIVDGVTNKVYTATDKNKLAGIASGATANSTDIQLRDRTTHTGVQPATSITPDATHRFVTDTEKTAWNAKQDASTAVTITGAQTLTNKTLSSPVISSIANGAATLTLPTTSGTVALTSQITGINSGVNTGDQVISDATLSLTDVTTGNVSTTKHGFVPKAPNDATKFLNGVGAWTTPAGGGDVTLAGVQTLSNKSISGDANTLSNIPASALLPTDTVTFDPASKQNTLVSGTNIKTINGTSILGSGDLPLAGGGGSSISTELAALGAPIKYLGVGTNYFTDENQSMEIDLFSGGGQILTAIYLPAGALITGLKYRMKRQGNYTASNFNGAGLYSVSGSTLTLIKQSANLPNIWKAATGSVVTIPFTSTYTIPTSGIYYASTMYSSTGGDVAAPRLVIRYGGFNSELNRGGFTNGLFINGLGGYASVLTASFNVNADIDRDNAPDPTWVAAY